MTPIDMAAIAAKVAWLAFALGMLFGATAQRTHFCTMGAFSDIFTMGDWSRMRQWLLAIAVAIIGTSLLAAAGSIDPAKSLYTGMRLNWLSHIASGAFFGFGMMIASGCGNKTLVRIGSGNLKSLVVFIVVGLTAFMTLRGMLAIPRTRLFDSQFIQLATRGDLPSMLAGASAQAAGAAGNLRLIIGGVAALLLLVFVFAGRDFRRRDAVVTNVTAGVVIGAIIVAAWYVSGHVGHVLEDPDTLQEAFVATNTGRMEAFSFVAPFAYTLDLLMMWTDVSKIVTFGIAATLGVIAGSFVMAVAGGAFRWEGFGGAGDLAHHLVGAMLMGFGGVMALGCTIGQGLSGIALLSLGSMLTLAGIVGGAYAAHRYQSWRVERA